MIHKPKGGIFKRRKLKLRRTKFFKTNTSFLPEYKRIMNFFEFYNISKQGLG